MVEIFAGLTAVLVLGFVLVWRRGKKAKAEAEAARQNFHSALSSSR